MAEKKRILILTADAGFGHRSAANAIASALSATYSEKCEVEVINPLEDRRVPSFLRDSQTEYDKFVRNMPELYKLEFQISDSPVPAAVIDSALTVILFPVIHTLIKTYDPQVILTTHPFFMAPLNAYITLHKLSIPFLTVVTDLTDVHRSWFNQGTDYCCVPTEEAVGQALNNSLSPEVVQATGIPINPAFPAETRSKSAIRAEHGWATDVITALVSGSKRVKNLMSFLHVLNHSGFPLQFVLVAGKDDDLFARFQTTDWHAVTHIYHYTDRMAEFMHASDLIIGKAGGLSTTEALACGLPFLIVDVTPGQEEGNASYVTKYGAGEIAKNPLEALEILSHWLFQDHRLLNERSKRSLSLGRPDSAFVVADLAWKAAEKGRAVPSSRLVSWIPRFKELLHSFDISITEEN